MCDYSLVPPDIQLKVRLLTPRPGHGSPQEARILIARLEEIMEKQKPGFDRDGKLYFMALYSEVSEWLPDNMTPKIVGGLLRALGLGSRRSGSGYQVFWTAEQLKVLKDYLAEHQ